MVPQAMSGPEFVSTTTVCDPVPETVTLAVVDAVQLLPPVPGAPPVPAPPGQADGPGPLLLRTSGRKRLGALARDAHAAILLVVALVLDAAPGRAHAADRGRHGGLEARWDVRGRVHAGGGRAAGEGLEGSHVHVSRRGRRVGRRGRDPIGVALLPI